MKKLNKLANLEQQAEEIMKAAENSGLQSNFFFLTTFERYRVQLRILKELESSIDSDGTLVTKEYVKGRQNLYTNPAISEYNRTTDSANKTVSTLMRIINQYNVDDQTENDDPLMRIINGDGANGNG